MPIDLACTPFAFQSITEGFALECATALDMLAERTDPSIFGPPLD